MKVEQFEFGTVEFHNNLVIGVMKQGVDFGKECVDTLIKRLNYHYPEKPFVYISHRKYDYSLNPAEARRLQESTHIKAAAFVLVRKLSYESFQTEKIFYKIPTATFPAIEEAINWANGIIADKESK